VVDRATGAALGAVDAVELVTVGQRRGIPVARDGASRVVVDVDVTAATVTVDRREAADIDHIALDGATLSWTGAPLRRHARVQVQTSAHGAPVDAVLHQIGTTAELALDRPCRPVAPGQLAVLYDPADVDRVVGAATVARLPQAA
jgi:tRNA-specific 2-thiouridylase